VSETGLCRHIPGAVLLPNVLLRDATGRKRSHRGHPLYLSCLGRSPLWKVKAPVTLKGATGARAALPQNCPRCESIAFERLWQEILGNDKVMISKGYEGGSTSEGHFRRRILEFASENFDAAQA
jgi:hypothetical protein